MKSIYNYPGSLQLKHLSSLRSCVIIWILWAQDEKCIITLYGCMADADCPVPDETASHREPDRRNRDIER